MKTITEHAHCSYFILVFQIFFSEQKKNFKKNMFYNKKKNFFFLFLKIKKYDVFKDLFKLFLLYFLGLFKKIIIQI